MPLLKYQFKPGIDKEGTSYTNEFGWYNSDKIRFRSGHPEKIGGWSKYSSNTFTGTARSLYNYGAATGTNYIGIGTHLKFYIVDGTAYNDITPIRATTTNGILFSATNGSSTITATDDAHGALLGDFVTISGAATLGGLITAAVLNQEYQITAVTTDTYTFTAKDTDGDTVTANASDSGNGGAGVDGAYQIHVGQDNYLSSTGWSADAWGEGTFGSASSLDATNQLRLYSQDNFGDDLVFNPRAGSIYYWDQSSGTSTRAVDFSSLGSASNTPTTALQIMVSDVDRHIICFGSNPIGSATLDPLLVRWSDQESAVDWTPSSTNSAGGVKISSGSKVVGALRTRQEILIWTDSALHSMRFVGAPFIFSFNELKGGVSMVSPKASVNANGMVYFMDRGGFFTYSGQVSPLPCSVRDYVYSDINLGQAYKIFATANIDFNEVMWFYPSSSASEIDRYVLYNYIENVWSVGTMVRTAWIEAHLENNPIAAGKSGTDANYLYNQEFGHDDDGSAMTAFIETADFDIEDGNNFMFVSKVIPDIEFRDADSGNAIDVSIKGRDYPNDSLSTLSTSSITNSTQQAFVRCRSRQAVLRFESSGTGYGWRLGYFRLDTRLDGRK
tara:strand:- start:1866 stop:3707 length:1842 start_codon:yes stop_codon:yes gene_type:complete